MNEIKLQPMPGWLIVKPADKKNKSGLYLPSNAGEQPQYGTVISLGGRIEKANERFEKEPMIRIGDTVHFAKWQGLALKVDNADYLFLKYEDILAAER